MLEDQISELQETVRDLREDQQQPSDDQHQETISELQTTVEEQSETIQSQSDRIDDLESQLDEVEDRFDTDVEMRLDAASKHRDSIEYDVAEIEDELDSLLGDCDDQTPTPNNAETALHDTIETSLEQICALPDDVAETELTANQYRARFLSLDIDDFGTSVPAGSALKSSDIRKFIRVKEDDSPHPQTIDRVIKFIDRFGGDDVKIVKKDGERRVIFTDDLVKRIKKIQSMNITPSVSQSKQLAVI